jgi:hypothetical protein
MDACSPFKDLLAGQEGVDLAERAQFRAGQTA